MDNVQAERLVRHTTALLRKGYDTDFVREQVLSQLTRIGTTPLSVLEEETAVAAAELFFAEQDRKRAAAAEERQRHAAENTAFR